MHNSATTPGPFRTPSRHLPRVCIFGAEGITLRSTPEARTYETNELDCHCFRSDDILEQALIALDPHVIVSIGETASFPNLMAAPFDIRRRWIHYATADDLDEIGRAAYFCYMAVCLDDRPEEPLVSIFTPTYRTGDKFERAWRSVMAQTYRNWEWVIYDDSGDEGRTADMISNYAAIEHRIRLIRTPRNLGVIGAVKYNACMASRGELLVELDHDDRLTPDALAHLVQASRDFPDAGFFYSDFAEVDNNLNPLRYADGWGYGYGSYRTENFEGRALAVVNAPNINPKTIRGLVAAPNHLRAWRRKTYLQVGGHNRLLAVADDMDLMVRTFLVTRMVRIPRLCYLQFMDGTNTQSALNKDIQRLVAWLHFKYDKRIHERFLELGLDDWAWNEERQHSELGRPNPEDEQSASFIARIA